MAHEATQRATQAERNNKQKTEENIMAALGKAAATAEASPARGATGESLAPDLAEVAPDLSEVVTALGRTIHQQTSTKHPFQKTTEKAVALLFEKKRAYQELEKQLASERAAHAERERELNGRVEDLTRTVAAFKATEVKQLFFCKFDLFPLFSS